MGRKQLFKSLQAPPRFRGGTKYGIATRPSVHAAGARLRRPFSVLSPAGPVRPMVARRHSPTPTAHATLPSPAQGKNFVWACWRRALGGEIEEDAAGRVKVAVCGERG